MTLTKSSFTIKRNKVMNTLLFLLLMAGFASCSEEAGGEANSPANAEEISAEMYGGEAHDPDIELEYDPAEHIPTDLEAVHSDRVRIEVHVEGFNSGGTANLIGQVGENRYLADTAVIDGQGRFVFEREEPYREGLYTVALPTNRGFHVILSEGQMDVSLSTVNGRLIEDMEVGEGNLENQLLYINLKYERVNRNQIDSINRQMNRLEEGSPEHEAEREIRDRLAAERRAHVAFIDKHYPDKLFTRYKVGGQNPVVRDIMNEDGTPDRRKQAYYFRNEFWDNVDFSDPRLINTPIIINKVRRYMDELVPQNADSINKYASLLMERVLDYPEYYQFFANWITMNFDHRETTIMDPEAVYVHMIQNYFTEDRAFWADAATIQGLQMRASEKENSLVGMVGPDVRAKGPDGNIHSIFEMEADYIIIYMYNPTCENCKKETPQLLEWYREWHPEADVFAIAIDTDDREWKEYIDQANIHDWVNVFDPTNRAIYKTYYVNITPEIYVLNPDREIIGKNLKTFQLETIINRDKERRDAM
ncbi:MAG: DUF5106 domain-containing protein [Saprospirales bacterium]|nr:MAG: DUF5106 domain-containing protein [Saprospirales bacterium]